MLRAVRSFASLTRRTKGPDKICRASLAKNAKADRFDDMGTKNISFPEELEAYVDAKVRSGEYAHASEVVREGIRSLMREEAEKLEWLRDAVAQAIAGADAGELSTTEETIEAVKRRGRAYLVRKRGNQSRRTARR